LSNALLLQPREPRSIAFAQSAGKVAGTSSERLGSDLLSVDFFLRRLEIEGEAGIFDARLANLHHLTSEGASETIIEYSMQFNIHKNRILLHEVSVVLK
jgi:hypothetical protein